MPDGAEEVVDTDRVILACSARAALRLLRGVPGLPASATDLTVPVGAPIARFTLVARAPGLGGEPVGSGLLVAPAEQAASHEVSCPARAKALSHLSAKWPWVGEELRALHGPDVHALRLSYGRPGRPRPEVDLSVALADVAALTGDRPHAGALGRDAATGDPRLPGAHDPSGGAALVGRGSGGHRSVGGGDRDRGRRRARPRRRRTPGGLA